MLHSYRYFFSCLNFQFIVAALLAVAAAAPSVYEQTGYMKDSGYRKDSGYMQSNYGSQNYKDGQDYSGIYIVSQSDYRKPDGSSSFEYVSVRILFLRMIYLYFNDLLAMCNPTTPPAKSPRSRS